MLRRGLVLWFLAAAPVQWAPASAAETWAEALATMPLDDRAAELTGTNCVPLMLRSFQSNAVVKALVFMPGATDEFYFFRRARATLTNGAPSLLDAVIALTNQTYIRATFRPPSLLLHTIEDLLTPAVTVAHEPTVQKLHAAWFVPHAQYHDRGWDRLQPILAQSLGVKVRPRNGSVDWYHFYRHSFAAWNLTGWEALEAVALAGKTVFTVADDRVEFAADVRPRPLPKLD